MKTRPDYVRMEDIARAAGCSTMTVSLALRNSPRVSAATKERIARLAKKMGYRPDPFVSAFVIRRSKPQQAGPDVIAVLTKGQTPARQKNGQDFYSQLWRGLEDRAFELRFRLEEFSSENGGAVEGRRLDRILSARGIRGVILFPGGDLRLSYPQLDWKRFAVVATGYHDPGIRVHRAASNYAHAMELALAQAQARGYQRIGLAMTPFLDPLIGYALSGRYFSWQQNLPLKQRLPLIPGKTEIPTARDFSRWEKRQRPDLILGLKSAIDWMSPLAPKTAFMDLAKREKSPFAGINLRTAEVGRTTIDLLVRELYLNRCGLPAIPELTLVGCAWEEGPGRPSAQARPIAGKGPIF